MIFKSKLSSDITYTKYSEMVTKNDAIDKKIEQQSQLNAVAFAKQDKNLVAVNESLTKLLGAISMLTTKVDSIENKIDTKIVANNNNIHKFIIEALKISSGTELSKGKLKQIDESYNKYGLGSIPEPAIQPSLQTKAIAQSKTSNRNSSNTLI